jgi:polysaccharide export outer membrane protein
MPSTALLPSRGSFGFTLAAALFLGAVTTFAQEATLDLREGTPIFRRNSSRRPMPASSSTAQQGPQAGVQNSSVARRVSSQQPYENAPSTENDGRRPTPAYASTYTPGGSNSGAVSSDPAAVGTDAGAEGAPPPAMSPGTARRTNPDVSPLLPLPNWEGSDVPMQAPDRMVGESPSANYILNPSDYVRILIYQEPDLATETRISKDGSINFPLIGMTQIGGKTVNEAVELIRKKLDADFLVNPQITLTVLEYSRARFTILGEVNHPGTYDIPREETVSLLDAVASAGGFTRTARTTSVTVKRKIDGRENVIKIDAKQMARESTATFNVLPGDTITVPTTIF